MDILPIETPRLLLRQFAVEDAEDVFAIFSDEQTTLDCGGYHAFDAMDEEYGRLMQKFFRPKPCIWPTGAVCLTNRARRGRETEMDMEEIQYLLGSAIFAWAKNYVKRMRIV